MIDTLAEESDFENSNRVLDNLNVDHLLKIATAMTRKYGYVSTQDYGEEISTRDACLQMYRGIMDDETLAIDTAPMLDWLNTQDASSDYIYNLKVATANVFAADKAAGLICSLPNVT